MPLASRQLPTPSLLQEGRGEEADWTLMRQDQVEIVFLDNRNLILPDSPEKQVKVLIAGRVNYTYCSFKIVKVTESLFGLCR